VPPVCLPPIYMLVARARAQLTLYIVARLETPAGQDQNCSALPDFQLPCPRRRGNFDLHCGI